MITGGLGFIGSNLARQLVALGADVLLVDSLHSRLRRQSVQHRRDRRPRARQRRRHPPAEHDELSRARPRGHLQPGRAGQPHRQHADPYTDLEINCRSQLTLLEACRYNNPGVKVVFAGTRQVYGRPDSLPVNESISCGRPTSTASTRPPASTTTSSTTTSSASAPARCGSRTSTVRAS